MWQIRGVSDIGNSGDASDPRSSGSLGRLLWFNQLRYEFFLIVYHTKALYSAYVSFTRAARMCSGDEPNLVFGSYADPAVAKLPVIATRYRPPARIVRKPLSHCAAPRTHNTCHHPHCVEQAPCTEAPRAKSSCSGARPGPGATLHYVVRILDPEGLPGSASLFCLPGRHEHSFV